jgi:hypothetical protein
MDWTEPPGKNLPGTEIESDTAMASYFVGTEAKTSKIIRLPATEARATIVNTSAKKSTHIQSEIDSDAFVNR